MKRKLSELQENSCVSKRKVSEQFLKEFTLANGLLGSVGAHLSLDEVATPVKYGEELEDNSETMTDKQDRSCKALADTTAESVELQELADAAKQLVGFQINETWENHADKLDTLSNFFEARECELQHELDK